MKHPLFFASQFILAALALVGAQASGCNGNDESPGDGGPDAADAGVDATDDGVANLPPPDGGRNCTLGANSNSTADYVDFCLQKQILVAEHKVFNPDAGIAPSWNATTGAPDTDGGAIAYDVNDNVAYGASLGLYSISAAQYGDTEIAGTIVGPDLTALSTLVQGELATLPASYDGELYLRLRRFAQGLDLLEQTADGAANGAPIDALAEAYGRAIYSNYFHALAAPPLSDAGTDAAADSGAGDAGDAGDDAGEDAGEDAGSEGGLANVPIADGILGVAQPGGGYLYNADWAASGAVALADLASRHETDDPTNAHIWARAAGSILNHLYTRARHPSGLYYTDLVTSADPDHDALASVLSPNDQLITETQASVAESLMRTSGIVTTDNLVELSLYPFLDQVKSALNGLEGIASDGGVGYRLWDPTSTVATSAACSTIEDASAGCGGSGFFVRYLPSTTGLDNSSKTIRGNALLWGAIYRSLVLPGTAASIDYEPLQALFEFQEGVQGDGFLTLVYNQASYPNAVSSGLALLPSSPSFTVQANAYAIEALTEQWIREADCPAEFY